jgi:protein-S-isoprenylcysteine O-methyltransferase Ste14
MPVMIIIAIFLSFMFVLSELILLLIMTGEAIVMNTLISFIVVFFPVCIAIMYRIRVEEKLLEKEFGEVYRLYRQKTKSIIPYIY